MQHETIELGRVEGRSVGPFVVGLDPMRQIDETDLGAVLDGNFYTHETSRHTHVHSSDVRGSAMVQP